MMRVPVSKVRYLHICIYQKRFLTTFNSIKSPHNLKKVDFQQPAVPRLLKEQIIEELLPNGNKRICKREGNELKWIDPITIKSGGLLEYVKSRTLSWLNAMFLPVGYPHSVHPSYTKFHLWQVFETLVWNCVSVLCSQAMLQSLGASATAATGGAVAIQWVLKDGIGEIGKLFFIQRFSHSLDSHPKTWKLIGECLSLGGSFMQLCTVIAPGTWFLPLASLGYALRCIHYSVWSASHMTFTRHFALTGNVGDLVAKDDSQMSLSHLLGMGMGVGLLTFSHSPMFLFTCFGLFAPIHFYSTVALINSAQFEILNPPKLAKIAVNWVKTGKVLSVQDMLKKENIFGEWATKDELKLELGTPLAKFNRSFDHFTAKLDLFKNESYLLEYEKQRKLFMITFHQDCEPHDIIKGILHASKYQELIDRGIHDSKELLEPELISSYEWTCANFAKFAAELDDNDWESDKVYWSDTGLRVKWDKTVPT